MVVTKFAGLDTQRFPAGGYATCLFVPVANAAVNGAISRHKQFLFHGNESPLRLPSLFVF
jgi:hypothetical protein